MNAKANGGLKKIQYRKQVSRGKKAKVKKPKPKNVFQNTQESLPDDTQHLKKTHTGKHFFHYNTLLIPRSHTSFTANNMLLFKISNSLLFSVNSKRTFVIYKKYSLIHI